MQLYRRLTFGDIVQVNVLDTRQYRSDQPANKEAAYTTATMTGDQQEQWLYNGLSASGARWNVLAQQVMVAQNDRLAGPGEQFDFDNWDGYRVPRQRLLDYFGEGRTQNPVVLTGDRHATWVCDLKRDFDDSSSATVGSEITGTSLSSGGNGNNVSFHQRYDPIQAESPHWKYIDGLRGYMVCDLNQVRMLTSLRTVPVVTDPNASTVYTSAQFVVEDGRPGIEVA